MESVPADGEPLAALRGQIEEMTRLLHDLREEVEELKKPGVRLLDREAAANALSISERTLDDRAARGEIQSVRIGFVVQALEEALVEEEELTREEFRSSLRESSPPTWHDDEMYVFSVGVEGGDEMIEMDYSQIIRALYPEIHLAEAVAGALDLLRGGDSPGDGPGEEVAEILEEALAQWSAPLGIEDISEV